MKPEWVPLKLFSDATEYGLRAVIWLAEQPPGTYKLIVIANATKAAPGYLIKVLQALARVGIVTAQRGTLGGFALARDPDGLTVLDVVAAIDPIERIRVCPLGVRAHGKKLCPMHRSIDEALAALEREFGQLTIRSLLGHSRASPGLCIERCRPSPRVAVSCTVTATSKDRRGPSHYRRKRALRARTTES